MYAIEVVHEWLCSNGFEVYDEKLAREEKKYMMLLPQSGQGKFKKDILYHHIGEKLFEKKDPLLKLHIQNKIRQLDKIINEMENMKKRDLEKRKEYINLKEKYEKALTTI